MPIRQAYTVDLPTVIMGENLHIDKQKLKKQFDTSNFGLNAILRGVQLTLVGGLHIPNSLFARVVETAHSLSN